MPYLIRKGKGPRPFKIINKATRKIVGTSKTKKAAMGSMLHRLEAKGELKMKKKNGRVRYS